MVVIFHSYCKRLPEGKPPFSYGFSGFPMVFLWFSYGYWLITPIGKCCADKASDVRDTSFFGIFWETSLADFAMNDTWGWGLAFPRMACLGFVKYSNLIEANCGEPW